MKGFKQKKFEIETLSRSYIESKRIINENSQRVCVPNSYRLERSIKIVGHIDNVVDCLNDNDRFIIQKEVQEGKRGIWYLNYFSSTSYYRLRDVAYDHFLGCL